jgi:hypothetical protein
MSNPATRLSRPLAKSSSCPVRTLLPSRTKAAQHIKIAPEPEAEPSEWRMASDAFSIVMVTQESSGIYERSGLGLLAKGALAKSIEAAEWKEVALG